MTRSLFEFRRLSLTDAAQLVFCTELQPSETPSTETIRWAVTRQLGRQGNALRAATEELATRYGDDPEAARSRMRWSRRMAAAAHLASS